MGRKLPAWLGFCPWYFRTYGVIHNRWRVCVEGRKLLSRTSSGAIGRSGQLAPYFGGAQVALTGRGSGDEGEEDAAAKGEEGDAQANQVADQASRGRGVGCALPLSDRDWQ